MKEHTTTAIVAVLLAVVGVAILAVLVSPQSQTPNILQRIGAAVSQMFCTALSPITGGGCTPSVTSTITF